MNLDIERNNKLVAVLERWIAFTGVKADQKQFVINLGGKIASSDIKNNYDAIQEADQLDPSGILPCMVFRNFLEVYIKQYTVPAALMLDLVTRKTEMARLDELEAIHKEVTDPVFTEAIEAIKDSMRLAADYYGYDKAKLEQVLSNDKLLEENLIGAFKGTEKMPEKWFSKGAYDKRPPKMFKSILSFENVLQSIQFAATMPEPFIALSVVYDKFNPLFSYFSFLCKSGQNVWILTDKTEWEHPGQEELVSSRGGGERFWEHSKEFGWEFPYGVVDRLQKKEDTIVSDVKISELDGYEITWLILVFERIRLKYFEGKYQPKQLVGFAMANPIVVQSGNTDDVRLLAESEGVKLLTDGSDMPTVVTIQNVEIPTIGKEETRTESMKDNFDHHTGKNDWLEARYEDRIPEVVYNANLLPSKSDTKLLPNGKPVEEIIDDSSEPFWEKDKIRQYRGLIRSMLGRKSSMTALGCCRSDLKKMEVDLGTQEEVHKKARWYARYNKATMVQYFTMEEFNQREDEVMESLQKIADKNRVNILQWAAKGELMTEAVRRKDSLFHNDSLEQKNIVKTVKEKRSWPPYSMSFKYRIWGNEHRDCRIPAVTCPITGMKATIFVLVEPKTAQALAQALNADVKDLPDVLRQFTRADVYSGNHLLNNVDPMDWCVRNPWNEMGIQIVVGFSVRGYKKMRKDMGLDTDMALIKETD